MSTLAQFVLVYMVFAYVALVAMGGTWRVDAAGLILGGASLGWAIEALVVPLVYEAPPLSFAWPSLGWHLVVVFGLGWVALGRMRRRWPAGRQVAVYLGLGIVWAVWGRLFWAEDPTMVLPAPQVLGVFALGTAALYGLGAWIVDRPVVQFRTGVADRIAAALIAVPLFAMMGAAYWPWALALGVIWAVTLVVLGRLPAQRGASTDAPPGPGAYIAILALPAGAVTGFAVVSDLPPGLSFLAVLPLTVLGTGGLAWALWRGLAR